MRYRHACGHLSRSSHKNVRAINGRQLGAGRGCVKANSSCMAARFQRILRLVVRLGLVRTKANTEDPKVTVFKREERTPWVKMSVPRHPPVQQPLITTDDLSLVASHNPAEVYSPFQLLPFTTCFLPERCMSSAKGVGRSKSSKVPA